MYDILLLLLSEHSVFSLASIILLENGESSIKCNKIWMPTYSIQGRLPGRIPALSQRETPAAGRVSGVPPFDFRDVDLCPGLLWESEPSVPYQDERLS